MAIFTIVSQASFTTSKVPPPSMHTMHAAPHVTTSTMHVITSTMHLTTSTHARMHARTHQHTQSHTYICSLSHSVWAAPATATTRRYNIHASRRYNRPAGMSRRTASAIAVAVALMSEPLQRLQRPRRGLLPLLLLGIPALLVAVAAAYTADTLPPPPALPALAAGALACARSGYCSDGFVTPWTGDIIKGEDCTALLRSVLHCTYCTLQHCAVLHGTVQYCRAGFITPWTGDNVTGEDCTALYRICIALYCTALCSTAQLAWHSTVLQLSACDAVGGRHCHG